MRLHHGGPNTDSSGPGVSQSLGPLEIFVGTSRLLGVGVSGRGPLPDRRLTLELYLPLVKVHVFWWR